MTGNTQAHKYHDMLSSSQRKEVWVDGWVSNALAFDMGDHLISWVQPTITVDF